ncbi:hypothetical protein ABZP36_006881 [Zizania latifolia]
MPIPSSSQLPSPFNVLADTLKICIKNTSSSTVIAIAVAVAAIAATMAAAAKVAMLLLFLVQIMNVLGGAAAARPLQLAGDGGRWMESAIGMVTEMLRGATSQPNPSTHCC